MDQPRRPAGTAAVGGLRKETGGMLKFWEVQGSAGLLVVPLLRPKNKGGHHIVEPPSALVADMHPCLVEEKGGCIHPGNTPASS